MISLIPALKNLLPGRNWVGKFHERQSELGSSVYNMAVLYFLPPDSKKANSWNDGFTAAIKILSSTREIKFFNAAIDWPQQSELERFDFVLVKSNWNWVLDEGFRKRYSNLKTRRGLLISGVAKPPVPSVALYYDLLWYQTDWYRPQIDFHPNCAKAFGINTEIMRPGNRPKIWDTISIGAFKPWKRYEKLALQPGRKLAVGERSSGDEPIVNSLKKAGVEVEDWVPPEELRNIILASGEVYIPAGLSGGGERAVLEARACGIPVRVEPDNPKLLELTSGPVLNQNDYVAGIGKVFEADTWERFCK